MIINVEKTRTKFTPHKIKDEQWGVWLPLTYVASTEKEADEMLTKLIKQKYVACDRKLKGSNEWGVYMSKSKIKTTLEKYK